MMQGFLIAEASLAEELKLQGAQASVVAAHGLESNSCTHRLSCSQTCGIFPIGTEPKIAALTGGFFTTEPPGKTPSLPS